MKKLWAGVLLVACVFLLAACGSQPLPRPRNQKIGLHQPTLPLKAVPSVRMYDSVNVDTIPLSATHVACYVSGRYANCAAMRARFPRASILTIATWDGAVARVLDTEPGDAVPSQDASWLRWMLRLHVYHPAIYASASEMAQVKWYLARSGIPRSSYLLWDADWTNRYGIDAGFDGTQYLSNCCVDISAMAPYFFVARPKPPKPPVPMTTCFGRRHTVAKCKVMWSSAAQGSRQAYDQAGCPVLSHRIAWFTAAVTKHPRVKIKRRRAALAASRRVYRQRGCRVLAQRVQYFEMKEKS